MKEAALTALIRPMPRHHYAADYPISGLRVGLDRFGDGLGGVNLNPDFQRGRVWSEGQQLAFVEALIRGALPQSLLTIQFNHPHFTDIGTKTDLPNEVQCIDGLQRMTALLRYSEGEMKPFGLDRSDFDGTRFDIRRWSTYTVRFQVFQFTRKKDLLEYYLDINSGGTPHTAEELGRVKELLKACNSGVVK